MHFSEEEFRVFGVSRQKAKYIKCLSEAIIQKTIDLNSLSVMTEIEVRESLIKIKGIGNWTIDVYLMFSLQSPDIIPLGDIAIINTIKELFNIHDKTEMQEYTQKWAPHRTAATFYCGIIICKNVTEKWFINHSNCLLKFLNFQL